MHIISDRRVNLQMPENQAHGKTWERDIAINIFKVNDAELDAISHTARFDIPANVNHLDGIDVSIKVAGGDSVDMGDILRRYDETHSGKPYHMIVVMWTQVNPTTKKVMGITEVDLTNSGSLIFGTATRERVEAFDTYVKSIPKNGRTTQHQETYKRMAADLKKECGGWISYAPKVDSKGQRRVQGRISKFRQFVKENPTRVIAESETCDFRGGKICDEIISPPRVRQKKKATDL